MRRRRDRMNGPRRGFATLNSRRLVLLTPTETTPSEVTPSAPPGSGIRLEREEGIEKILIDYPSSLGGRVITFIASLFFTGVVLFVCVQTYEELERVPGFLVFF